MRRKILRLYMAYKLSIRALSSASSRYVIHDIDKKEDAVSMTGHRILFIGLTDNNHYRSVIDQD